MTLADILAQHSRDISASIDHTNDLAQDNVERKANTLEERFQHSKDAIEGLGGEIAGLGGAWHLGRKMYNKYRTRQTPQSKARENAQADDTKPSTQAQEPDKPVDPDDKPGTAPKQGADDPVSEGDTFFPGEEGAEEAGDIFKTGEFPDLPRQPGISTGTGKPPPLPDKPQPTQATDANAQPDPVQAQPEDIRPTNADASVRSAPEAQASGTQAQEETQVGNDQASEQPENLGRRGTALQESKQGPAGNDQAVPEANETPGGDAEAPRLGDQGTDLTPATEAVDQSAGDLGESNGLSDIVDQGAQKIGSKLAGIGGDALSDGLATASSVLDFLGPIGEGLGLITSLIGVFEGLGHKKAQVAETGQEASAEGGNVEAGLDPEALEKEQSGNQAVGVEV